MTIVTTAEMTTITVGVMTTLTTTELQRSERIRGALSALLQV